MSSMIFSLVEFLGQAGFRISWGDWVIYMDPYLSDSVQQLDAPDLVRQVPTPIDPSQVNDADWVLVTHAHIDHCDPYSLPEISEASPSARFMGPRPVLERLQQWGVQADRLQLAQESWGELLPDLHIHAVPAAHPTIARDEQEGLACVGYILEGFDGHRTYFAGDTGVCAELLKALLAQAPLHTVCLPVNEQNFFRERRNIIGNMSIREAYLLAQEVGAHRMFPCHWDMFAANSAYPEEIQLIHNKMQPGFELISAPFKLFPED